MKNRWKLSKEVKDKWEPVIQAWLSKINNMTEEEIESAPDDTFSLDLSDTELNPYTLWGLLEGIGYKKTGAEDNGWELDFWINFDVINQPAGSITNALCVHGCGMTFELKLSLSEFM